MPEGEKSLFGLKAQYIAMVSYIILIAHRLIRTILFILESEYLLDYSLLTRTTAFLSTYYNWYELLFAAIPIVILVLEKKSKLVRFHCFQYLIMDLFLPLIYLLVVLVLSLLVSSTNDVLVMILFLYGSMLVVGTIAIFMTFLNAYATYCAYKGRTSNFPIFSSLAYRLAKIDASTQESH